MPASRARRALVVGPGRSRGMLAAVRALGRAGWHVGVGTPVDDAMVGASRWVDATHVVARPRLDGASFLTSLATAVDQGRYDVVFAGADDWVAALATWRDRVPTRVAHPPGDVVGEAMDKLALPERAAKADLASPVTEEATPEALAAWRGPVVVKCRSHWRPGVRHDYRIETRRYDSVDQCGSRLALIRRGGLEPVLQAPIDGTLSAVVGLFRDGRLEGVVQQASPALWPTPSGVSARAVTVTPEPDLVARCEDLLADLGWSGLVELQFLTPAGGQPHLIDLNGRFYGSMALALAAGSNLPDAWGRVVLGEEVPRLPPARPGVRYAWVAGDVRRAMLERRGGLLADLATSVRWLAATSATSVWDPTDLGPIWHVAASQFRSRDLG